MQNLSYLLPNCLTITNTKDAAKVLLGALGAAYAFGAFGFMHAAAVSTAEAAAGAGFKAGISTIPFIGTTVANTALANSMAGAVGKIAGAEAYALLKTTPYLGFSYEKSLAVAAAGYAAGSTLADYGITCGKKIFDATKFMSSWVYKSPAKSQVSEEKKELVIR